MMEISKVTTTCLKWMANLSQVLVYCKAKVRILFEINLDLNTIEIETKTWNTYKKDILIFKLVIILLKWLCVLNVYTIKWHCWFIGVINGLNF